MSQLPRGSNRSRGHRAHPPYRHARHKHMGYAHYTGLRVAMPSVNRSRPRPFDSRSGRRS